jgi:hypothetical protein
MAPKTTREEPVKTTATYRNRFARHLALGFAIAAVAAPIAQADVSIPAELSNRQFGPTLAVAGVDRQPGTVPAELDGRHFGPSALPRATIPADLSGRDFGPATFATDIPVVVPVATGFDWRDAGVGAAAVAAIALAIGALALLLGRRRHPVGA